MTEPIRPQLRPQPGKTPAAVAAEQARREREAAALRENLRRRKEQARARAEPPPDRDSLPESPDLG